MLKSNINFLIPSGQFQAGMMTDSNKTMVFSLLQIKRDIFIQL
jgi:hypothetical protein